MTKVNLTCRYCNHIWDESFYSKTQIDNKKCPKCKSGDLTVRESSTAKIDTYAGAPAFRDDGIDDMVKKLQEALDLDWKSKVDYL